MDNVAVRHIERADPATIDALVETWDMRQPVRLRQRCDDAGAPLQRRRLQPPIDLGQRHPQEIIIADGRGDLLRRKGFNCGALQWRQAQPLPD